jgi:hypothetical protein
LRQVIAVKRAKGVSGTDLGGMARRIGTNLKKDIQLAPNFKKLV